jgi:hypothetical protein
VLALEPGGEVLQLPTGSFTLPRHEAAEPVEGEPNGLGVVGQPFIQCPDHPAEAEAGNGRLQPPPDAAGVAHVQPILQDLTERFPPKLAAGDQIEAKAQAQAQNTADEGEAFRLGK